MVRRLRVCPVGIPQHIIQRGNNRQVCFAGETDFAIYRRWLEEIAKQYEVEIHAWVFMTNHVHVLATPRSEGAISAMMQSLGRRYVRYFNRAYQRTGTLWEGRFRSCLVHSEAYLLICQRYIELNPVRAGMVQDPAAYHWSSYHAHARGVESSLWTPHGEYLKLGDTKSARLMAYRELFKQALPSSQIDEIRHSTNKSLALGNDRFREEISRLTGIRQHLEKPGPKSKSGSE